MVPPLDGRWRTSTRSQGNGNCVEVRLSEGFVQVRDTKDRPGPTLDFTPHQWAAFVRDIANCGISSPS
ncbi:DUF397 domain-containing protein [Micromonospora sp. CPCC 206061]|uniref:DUF397 domain-containing protein n=1 Tax=Micromonospora sp. CPCC 206061 TaxID=3122410 RepID=UPI002FEFE6D2